MSNDAATSLARQMNIVYDYQRFRVKGTKEDGTPCSTTISLEPLFVAHMVNKVGPLEQIRELVREINNSYVSKKENGITRSRFIRQGLEKFMKEVQEGKIPPLKAGIRPIGVVNVSTPGAAPVPGHLPPAPVMTCSFGYGPPSVG